MHFGTRFLTLAVALILVGCGEAGAGPPSPDASAFLGVWSCSLTQIESCPTGSHQDDFLYTATFSSAGTPSTIFTVGTASTDTTTGGYYPGPGAPVRWMVSGTQATLDGVQTFPTGPGSLGGTWTPTSTSGGMTLVGNTLSGSSAGNAVYANGVIETCGFSQTFECTR